MTNYIVIISIRTKIISAFLLTTTVIVVGMYAFIQWSFDRGFRDYINSQHNLQLDNLSQALANYYQDQGNWSELILNRRSWHRFLRESLDEGGDIFSGAPPQYIGPSNQVIPPTARSLPESQSRRKSSQFGPKDSNEFRPRLNRPPTHEGRRPLITVPREATWNLALFAPKKNILIARPGETGQDFTLVPITIEGNLIGYIGAKPATSITNPLDVNFIEQQTQALLYISMWMGLLALVIAIPLALHLVKPIRQLTRGTQLLTAGHYNSRIVVKSHDELELLARDFNTLAHTLEANEEARKRWVADISHELRTPLAVLKGQIEAIQDGIRQATPETLQILSNKVTQLTRLVSDLYDLSLSDLGALSYRKENIEIRDLIEDSLESFKDAFKENSISLHTEINIDKDLTIFADAERLSQLINNLVKNSLRYTDSGGSLIISATQSEKGLKIEFNDTAPSVPSDELPKLFDRLYRVESSRNRALGGAGLGLSICKSIIETHGGIISAQPSNNGGLCILIELPFHGQPQHN